MKKLLVLACAWLAFLGADSTSAPIPSPTPSPVPIEMQYDDPAMHYDAPAGWVRIPVSRLPSNQTGFQPLAIFTRDQGRYEQKTIIIAAEPYEGTLDGFESSTENELRSGSEVTFVDKKTRLVMKNGMPAYWMKISRGDQAGKLYQTYQYAIFDGKRGIVASVSARLGDVREEQAREWLSSLRVVLYPRNRN